MESSSFAIEIDGEAICLDNDGENGEDEKSSEEAEEQGKEFAHVGDIEIEDRTDGLKDGEEKHSLASTRDEFTEELFGKIVHSEEEAYRLYCDYGHHMGFSVRKGKQYYFTGTKRIRTKDYYCSKEGLKDDEQLTEANYNRPETRTNCKAMIRFRVDSQGQWKVIQFVPEHNHELVHPGERHLLRSVKSLCVPKPGPISGMSNAECQPENERLHKSEEHGFGYTVTSDCSNEGCAQNKMFIEPEDAQNLINHFKRRCVEDCMFYWDVQVDNAGRMSNFYWRDARNRVDYDCFGDVLVLDTTHRINRYGLICVPFVGTNHHWQNVMFGCAFLSDESSGSFEWLFRSFLESMGGHPPRSLFTDNNMAMFKAIQEVLPTTRHCISQWHIEKNLISHMGTIDNFGTLSSMFTRCMRVCDSETEFEDSWAMMVHEYNLHDNRWLGDLYDLRYKWCFAFQKDAFDAGIQSDERGESMNAVLNSISDGTMSLSDILFEFEKILKTWRSKEYEESLLSCQSIPDSSIKHSSFLRHAMEVYTPRLYTLFEREFLEACGTLAYQEIPLGGSLYRLEFMLQVRSPKIWSVLLDSSTMEVTCSCKRFETMGLLCPHALNALSLKNLDRIPDMYILKRWTKDAKKRIYEFKQDSSLYHDSSHAEVTFHNRAMLFVYNVLMKSKHQKDTRRIVSSALEGAEQALNDTIEFRTPKIHSFGRDKETNKSDKRKRKLSKQEKNPRKVKPSLMVASAEPEYTAPSSENQFFPIEEITNNSSMNRPYFYHQAYPANGTAASQIHGNMNMHHQMPHCATEDYSAYGTMPPAPTFGGAGNF